MRQIISIIYGVLLIAVWICVMGIVIAVLDSGGPNWLLLAAGFVAATITVTLAFPPEHYEECIGAKKHLVLGVLSHTGPLGSNSFVII
jgi:hypothetical protein